MTKYMYALRDEKMGSFNPPIIMDNDAVAVRAFGDLVNKDRDSLIGQHPEDFALYYLGTFDTVSGLFSSAPTDIRLLARGSDFKKGE